jgi:cellobiose epimerase
MFLTAILTTIVLSTFAGEPAPTAKPAWPAPTTPPSAEAYLRVAAEVEENLQKEILDKWFPAAVEKENGGFHENYSNDWTRGAGNNKSIVYQARCTWTSAEAAIRFPDKAKLYLEMTRHGAACLADKLWDKENGGFYWSVGPTGQPIAGRGGMGRAGGAAGAPTGVSKEIYGHAFGIYAMAANYKATKDEPALALAKKAFQWLEEHAHDKENKGYFEIIGPDGKPAASGSSAVGANAQQKSMNTSIHVLEALTALCQVWPDPLVKVRVQEMLDVCRDKFYAEPGYLTQFSSLTWERRQSADSFGHDVEAGFLMVEAAEVLGKGEDARMWTAARRLVDHAMQYAWDSERGGIYDSGAMNAEGVVTGGLRTEKIWWVEAEHLNALLLQHEHVGKETGKYWDAFLKQWEWISKYQVDHANGGWWPTVSAAGAPASRVKADSWTECYHQGRAMLNVSARLRKMAEAAKKK